MDSVDCKFHSEEFLVLDLCKGPNSHYDDESKMQKCTVAQVRIAVPTAFVDDTKKRRLESIISVVS